MVEIFVPPFAMGNTLVTSEVKLIAPPLVDKVPVPPVVRTIPFVDKPENAIVPEEEIPVAAEIAPDEFTWNCDDVPTERSEGGVFVPMPTKSEAVVKKIFPADFDQGPFPEVINTQAGVVVVLVL